MAIQEYMDLRKYQRLYQGPMMIPDEPPAYREYRKCERWGFPRDGGWADQPAGYMQDIWAAEKGVKQFENMKRRTEFAEVRER